jgi:anti-anti-sigma factor
VDILEEKSGASVVLGLQGRLDHTSVEATEQRLLAALEAGHRQLIIDLASLDYISSAGLRVLLIVAKKAKALGGRIALCSPRPFVKEILDVSGFSTIFSTWGTREEALAAVTQHE